MKNSIISESIAISVSNLVEKIGQCVCNRTANGVLLVIYSWIIVGYYFPLLGIALVDQLPCSCVTSSFTDYAEENWVQSFSSYLGMPQKCYAEAAVCRCSSK